MIFGRNSKIQRGYFVANAMCITIWTNGFETSVFINPLACACVVLTFSFQMHIIFHVECYLVGVFLVFEFFFFCSSVRLFLSLVLARCSFAVCLCIRCYEALRSFCSAGKWLKWWCVSFFAKLLDYDEYLCWNTAKASTQIERVSSIYKWLTDRQTLA